MRNATCHLGINFKRITIRKLVPRTRSRHPERRWSLARVHGARRSGPPEPGDADGGSA